MKQSQTMRIWTMTALFVLLTTGCGVLPTAKKPETGPVGATAEESESPGLAEQLSPPPANLYDLETKASLVFEGITKYDWQQAATSLTEMRSLWQNLQGTVGTKKGAADAKKAWKLLEQAIAEKNSLFAFEALNQYMGSISEIAKTYKLSPLADIITIDNNIRTVSYYVKNKDWLKASAKIKELEGSWEQVKPSMEKLGILSQITRTHSVINQMKDAVDAENQGKFEGQLTTINDSMGRIRDYYHGK